MFQQFYTTLIAFITRLCGFTTPTAIRVPVARRGRGATFIEYALLAAVALVVVVIFRTQLSSIFTSLMDRLRSATS
jgi:Flp pilus assembly pilin Flp